MHYAQSPPLNDQYHARDTNASNLDFERLSSDRRTGIMEGPDDRLYRPRIGISRRSSGFKNDPFVSGRPSIGRRIYRSLARFFFAVLIGVGGTLAWQCYADQANGMVRTWAPSLGWLLPASAMKSPARAVTSADLEPIALDLAIVRRSIEQLVANQDQLARRQEQLGETMATLQATEQDVVQKISSPPPPTSRTVRVSPPKTPQQEAQ
jgi:hypothetical protein